MTRQRAQNVDLGSDVARANLLTNGGFEIWQRGNGPFTTNNAYSADRWTHFLGGTSTISVTKTTSGSSSANAPNGALTATYTHNTESFITQYVQQGDKADYTCAGRTITFAMDVNTSTASAVRLRLATNGTGGTSTYSAYAAGTGAWQRLSVSVLVPTDASTVTVGVSLMASCTFYLNDAMLVVGSVAADYAPLHPADDLARCQRYYQILCAGQEWNWSANGAHVLGIGYPFQALMSVIPTLTKLGTWGVANCSQPTFTVGTGMGFRMYTTATAAGQVNLATNNAQGVVAEANP